MDVTVLCHPLSFVLAPGFACRVAVRLTDEQREELSRSESRKSPSVMYNRMSDYRVILPIK
jgi:hypothetical protein